jgi:hypothetical protein
MKNKSVVGDLINFRGLVYSPMNENGVVFLFGKVVEDLNMYIEEIKPGFPDCYARRYSGKGWEKVAIEFEYLSSNFKLHKHDPNDCDIIVCWENDWPSCPIEVIELKEEIKKFENYPIERPDVASEKDERAFENQFNSLPDNVKNIFNALDPKIKEISPDIWRKDLNTRGVNYYSPEKVFLYIDFQKQGLKISLFTKGNQIDGVKPFNYERAGFKWGHLHLTNESQITAVIPILKKSYELMKDAIKHNELTGWYAPLKQEKVSSE